MKIYTKTGDNGETSLFGGTRISKASARVEAYGTVDELNSFIGNLKAQITEDKIIGQLKNIQFNLFTLGSEVATPPDKILLANGESRLPIVISEENITELENWLDDLDENLTPLQFFILPGGGSSAAAAHMARTVCRRAERTLVFLAENEKVRPEIIKYLNRLSDYLFILARYVAHKNGEAEEYWNPSER